MCVLYLGRKSNLVFETEISFSFCSRYFASLICHYNKRMKYNSLDENAITIIRSCNKFNRAIVEFAFRRVKTAICNK